MRLEALLQPGLLGVATFLFGLVIGSFLNVVIHRLPRGESLVRPRSRCPSCQHAISAWQNVPLLSYVWLRGRCRACGIRISPRYPIVEALTGTLFVALVLRHGAAPMTAFWMAFAATLLAVAVIDLDHRVIPDELSLGGLGVGLLGVPVVQGLSGVPLAAAFQTAASGALLGGGVLWSVGFLHARYAALTGRRFEHWPGPGEEPPRVSSLDYWTWFPGMGFGDVKLMAMIGAFLGPLGAVRAVVAASIVGLVWGLTWVALTRSWSAPFGFGPAIALGALLVVLGPANCLLS
jgi:leader peptidase (prepilin peptidase)/N-methyltransferase